MEFGESFKYLGFFKEHDNIDVSISFIEKRSVAKNDTRYSNEVLEYLENGNLICSWMGYCYDILDGEQINPHSYLTDGHWLWPSYLTHYLRKYDFLKLDDEFLDEIQRNKYRMNELNRRELVKIQNIFMTKFDSHSNES